MEDRTLSDYAKKKELGVTSVKVKAFTKCLLVQTTVFKRLMDEFLGMDHTGSCAGYRTSNTVGVILLEVPHGKPHMSETCGRFAQNHAEKSYQPHIMWSIYHQDPLPSCVCRLRGCVCVNSQVSSCASVASDHSR